MLKAIKHEQPDRVPIDFGGMRSTTIMAVGYNKLKEYLGIDTGQTLVYDTMQMLAEIEKPILDRFQIDVVDALNTFGRHPERWYPWKLQDGSQAYLPVGFEPQDDGYGGYLIKDNDGNVLMESPQGCLYFNPVFHPMAHLTTISELEDYNFGLISNETLDRLHETAKWTYENTEYAIMAGFGGNILESGQNLRGWDQFMVDMAGDPEFTHVMLDRLADSHIENLKRFLEAVGPYVQLIQMGDDLGTQSAPQLSVNMYREFIKPRHKRVYDYVKQNSDIHVFLHSCGSIYDLIPDLIDAGVEVLNPVQTSAANMDPRKLKDEFGDKLTFWGGGCDTQTILPNAKPEEIRKHVKERMEIFKPGGGFIFNQVHNVQANVAPENIIAMFDAAYEFGWY
ncbi:MAG: uroporphyrinogen decarboxylase family protein [Armatimonadota bacterium]